MDTKRKEYKLSFHYIDEDKIQCEEDKNTFEPTKVRVYTGAIELLDAINALLIKTGQNIIIESYEEQDTNE